MVRGYKSKTLSAKPRSPQFQIPRPCIVYGLAVAIPASLLLAAGTANAQTAPAGADGLEALQRSIAAQEARLNQEESQLEQQSLELSQQQQLLDREMAKLRGAGTASTSQPTPLNTAPATQVVAAQPSPSDNSDDQNAPSSGTVGAQQQQQQLQQQH
jgi:hypothetical protein